MVELMKHDAADLLPAIRCPVLVVGGCDDTLTPPAAAQDMADRTPGATLVLLPDTSHFGVIEHGPALWSAIDELLSGL